jgi:hypothetical protein
LDILARLERNSHTAIARRFAAAREAASQRFRQDKKAPLERGFSVGFQLLLATEGAAMIVVLARRARYAAAQERTRSRAYGDADREPRLKCKSVISLPT